MVVSDSQWIKIRKGARELRDIVVNRSHLVCHFYICVIISLTLSIGFLALCFSLCVPSS